MLISPVSLFFLIVTIIAVWILLRVRNPLWRLIVTGIAIVGCILGFDFSPWPVQTLIVLALIGLGRFGLG